MDSPPLPARARHTPHQHHHAATATTPPPTHRPASTAGWLHHIDSLKPGVSRLNDYVDTRTLPNGGPASVHQKPAAVASPPPPKAKGDLTVKCSTTSRAANRELSDNLRNERRELCFYNQRAQPPPLLPPRTYKPPSAEAPPPPLLPRKVGGLEREVPPPVLRRNKPASVAGDANSRQRGRAASRRHDRPSPTKPTPAAAPVAPAPAVLIVDVHSSPARHKTWCGSGSAVTKQPAKQELTAKLDKAAAGGGVTNSIICDECGQCRCSSCTRDQRLPETWLCDGNCRCSADSVVDIASCMCVVKGVYSSCYDNQSDNVSPVRPYACTEAAGCCPRWTGLALLSLCFPCLCCFLPMKAGVAAAEKCYNCACRKRGCKCDAVR